jgi:type III secretion protein L
VSKKYFNLIFGGILKTAPSTKVISAKAFSELLTGQELLDKIKLEAEEYRKQVITESETIKEQAQREGFEAGYQEWVKQVAKLEEEIGRVHDEMMKLAMPVALKAAKKIVAAELEISETAIVNIVMHTLKAVAQHKKIVLYVNKADYETIESNKNKIKGLFEALESLSIRERDDVEQGGAIIETEVGIINAQLQDRWRSLEAAFETMAAQLKRE